MDLNRRAFLGASAAVAASSPSFALIPRKPQANGDLTLDFEDAGGSTLNSGLRNKRVYSNAINYLDRKGGGTLFVPAKTYPFEGVSFCSATNVTVLAYGATFAGDDCRISILGDSVAYNIHGLTIVDTSGTASSYLLECSGTASHFKDLHLEKRPAAGGYIGYCREETSNVLFENVSFAGSNGIFLGGHDHEIRGGWAQADAGGDDCWALKSTQFPCYNIHISDFRAYGFAALVAVGSEIGTLGTDNPDHDLYVKNVVVENCLASACVHLAYIKPGGVKQDYRDGVVENILIRNCTHEDPNGASFRNSIYVSPGRGASVRGVIVEDLTVTARGMYPAAQLISPIYLRVLNSTNGAGAGGSIEDISISRIHCTDPFGGTAQSSAKGLPLDSLVGIEKQNSNIGKIGRVDVIDASLNGCARMAAFVGPNVEGPINLSGCTLANYAASIMSAKDKGSVLALSPILLKDITALPSASAPQDTRGILADSHPAKTVEYRGDISKLSLTSVPGGASIAQPIYSALRDAWISKVEITVAEEVVQNDVNFVRFVLRNSGTGEVIGSANTATGGLQLRSDTPTSINGAAQFSGHPPCLSKGAQLVLEISSSGSGAFLADPIVTIHAVPYGQG